MLEHIAQGEHTVMEYHTKDAEASQLIEGVYPSFRGQEITFFKNNVEIASKS